MTAGKDYTSVEAIAYTLPESASAVRLSVDSLQKAIRAGDLVAKKFGKKTLIDPQELKRWFHSLPDEADRVA